MASAWERVEDLVEVLNIRAHDRTFNHISLIATWLTTQSCLAGCRHVETLLPKLLGHQFVPPGEPVVYAGEPHTALCIVLSGSCVELPDAAVAGRAGVGYMMTSGAIFGDGCLLELHPMSHNDIMAGPSGVHLATLGLARCQTLQRQAMQGQSPYVGVSQALLAACCRRYVEVPPARRHPRDVQHFAKLLQHIKPFKKASVEVCAKMAHVCSVVHVAPDDLVVLEGQLLSATHVVLAGVVRQHSSACRSPAHRQHMGPVRGDHRLMRSGGDRAASPVMGDSLPERLPTTRKGLFRAGMGDPQRRGYWEEVEEDGSSEGSGDDDCSDGGDDNVVGKCQAVLVDALDLERFDVPGEARPGCRERDGSGDEGSGRLAACAHADECSSPASGRSSPMRHFRSNNLFVRGGGGRDGLGGLVKTLHVGNSFGKFRQAPVPAPASYVAGRCTIDTDGRATAAPEGARGATVLVLTHQQYQDCIWDGQMLQLDSLLEFLHSVPPFRDLTGVDLTVMALGAKPMTLQDGDVLAREGAPVDALYLIMKGKVRLAVQSSHPLEAADASGTNDAAAAAPDAGSNDDLSPGVPSPSTAIRANKSKGVEAAGRQYTLYRTEVVGEGFFGLPGSSNFDIMNSWVGNNYKTDSHLKQLMDANSSVEPSLPRAPPQRVCATHLATACSVGETSLLVLGAAALQALDHVLRPRLQEYAREQQEVLAGRRNRPAMAEEREDAWRAQQQQQQQQQQPQSAAPIVFQPPPPMPPPPTGPPKDTKTIKYLKPGIGYACAAGVAPLPSTVERAHATYMKKLSKAQQEATAAESSVEPSGGGSLGARNGASGGELRFDDLLDQLPPVPPSPLLAPFRRNSSPYQPSGGGKDGSLSSSPLSSMQQPFSASQVQLPSSASCFGFGGGGGGKSPTGRLSYSNSVDFDQDQRSSSNRSYTSDSSIGGGGGGGQAAQERVGRFSRFNLNEEGGILLDGCGPVGRRIGFPPQRNASESQLIADPHRARDGGGGNAPRTPADRPRTVLFESPFASDAASPSGGRKDGDASPKERGDADRLNGPSPPGCGGPRRSSSCVASGFRLMDNTASQKMRTKSVRALMRLGLTACLEPAPPLSRCVRRGSSGECGPAAEPPAGPARTLSLGLALAAGDLGIDPEASANASQLTRSRTITFQPPTISIPPTPTLLESSTPSPSAAPPQPASSSGDPLWPAAAARPPSSASPQQPRPPSRQLSQASLSSQGTADGLTSPSSSIMLKMHSITSLGRRPSSPLTPGGSATGPLPVLADAAGFSGGGAGGGGNSNRWDSSTSPASPAGSKQKLTNHRLSSAGVSPGDKAAASPGRADKPDDAAAAPVASSPRPLPVPRVNIVNPQALLPLALQTNPNMGFGRYLAEMQAESGVAALQRRGDERLPASFTRGRKQGC